MSDMTNTTDEVDPLQCAAMIHDAASVEDEAKACEEQTLSYQEYVAQFCSDHSEGLDGADTCPEQGAELCFEDGTHPHAQLIAQARKTLADTQAALKALPRKAKKKS